MTTVPPVPPAEAAAGRLMCLSGLLGRPLSDRGGHPLGQLCYVIVRLRGAQYPLVTGLVAAVGRRKVTTLMGFDPGSAGGLMGLDFLALPGDLAVRDALAAVTRATTLQPEALTTVHAVDSGGRQGREAIGHGT